MRPAVLDFARDVAENFPMAEPIVEMGSRAAAGQEDIADVRGIFGASEHIGCDLQPGRGVDRIEDIHHLTFPDASIGTVLAFETLEHVADPIRAVDEMYRVLRPGGVLAMSSLMFFPIHEHPSDYWRFTPQGFELLLQQFESRLVLSQGWALLPQGVFGVGVKGPYPDLTSVRLPRTQNTALLWDAGKPVDFGPMRMSLRELWGHTLHYTKLAGRQRLGKLTRSR